MKAFLAILCMSLLAAAGCAPHYDNPMDDPDWIPIAVNIQSVHNAHIYAAAGINTYIGIDDVLDKPTEDYQVAATPETLGILADLDMHAMVFQDQWGRLKDHPVIIAWLSLVDEPDNIQSTGKAIPLKDYLEAAETIKQFDPTHPYTVCFGQGVINDLFKGRGIHRSEYRRYMKVVDFIQYDVYPITNSRRADGENYLELTGQGVSRIRQWTNNRKPVMCWIETNHIKHPTKAPTPAQTCCEVWICMVHGARGVGYFCHDFTLPAKRASALSRDAAMLAPLARTNAKLAALARIINAPMATEPTVLKSDAGRVIASTKRVDGDTIVLAVNVRDVAARATVPAPGVKAGDTIEVLQEARTVAADADGRFTDTFVPYQEHIYRIR